MTGCCARDSFLYRADRADRHELTDQQRTAGTKKESHSVPVRYATLPKLSTLARERVGSDITSNQPKSVLPSLETRPPSPTLVSQRNQCFCVRVHPGSSMVHPPLPCGHTMITALCLFSTQRFRQKRGTSSMNRSVADHQPDSSLASRGETRCSTMIRRQAVVSLRHSRSMLAERYV